MITPPHYNAEIQRVGRLEWIDALRAVAMILVVYNHVYRFTFDCNDYADHTIIGNIFPMLALPLFFFISGFLSVKKTGYWKSHSNFCNQVKKRTIQLLVPTVVFYFLLSRFVIVLPFPGGYWFTLVLLEMYLFFYTLEFVLCRLSDNLRALILIAIATILFLIKRIVANMHIPFLELANFCEYFIYLVLGYVAARYKSIISDKIKSQYIVNGGLVVFVLLYCIDVTGPLSTLIIQLKRIVAVSLAVVLAYVNKSYFENSGFVARIFQYIGKRTLDLYMVHYFFLWPTIPLVAGILKGSQNQPLEILIIGTWTVLVVALSLFSIRIMRSGKFLSRYLFAS